MMKHINADLCDIDIGMWLRVLTCPELPAKAVDGVPLVSIVKLEHLTDHADGPLVLVHRLPRRIDVVQRLTVQRVATAHRGKEARRE
jgi:hypothetical protein